ncbi:hypothetical protein [Neptuniibacter sp. QD37_11]|uniref:hypothetical protein n=1 Tax=Neptuniibacter sp. QD37_11 TaxID=3398209 RepID=UPI0039F60D0F
MNSYPLSLNMGSNSNSYEIDLQIDPDLSTSPTDQFYEQIRSKLYESMKSEGYYERYEVGRNGFGGEHVTKVISQSIESAIESLKNLEGNSDNLSRADLFQRELSYALGDMFEEEEWFPDQSYEAMSWQLKDSDIASFFEACEPIFESENIHLDKTDVEDFIKNLYQEALCDQDETTPLDVLKHADKVRMIYMFKPEIGSKYAEDNLVECNHVTGESTMVIPDDSFVAYLTALNVPVSDYVSAVKTKYNIDLCSEDECDISDQWQKALADDSKINPHQPQVLSMDSIFETIDNMNGYASPCLIADIDPMRFGDLFEESSLVITGGQIGLHDFLNGSGHVLSPENPIVIKSSLDDWQFDGQVGPYEVDEVYGMVNSAYEAEIKLSRQPSVELTNDNDCSL